MPNWRAHFIDAGHSILSYAVISLIEVACCIISTWGRYFRSKILCPLSIDWVSSIVQYILILYSTGTLDVKYSVFHLLTGLIVQYILILYSTCGLLFGTLQPTPLDGSTNTAGSERDRIHPMKTNSTTDIESSIRPSVSVFVPLGPWIVGKAQSPITCSFQANTTYRTKLGGNTHHHTPKHPPT